MKRALLLGGFVVVGAVAGVAGYYWTQATYLPQWYRPSGDSLSQEAAAATSLLDHRPLAIAPGGSAGQVVLDEAAFNQVVMQAIASQPQAEPLLQAAKGMNTSIHPDHIQSGVVVNLAEVPVELLPPQGQQALAQLTQTFPILADRDVYIGIQGRPQVVDGRLVLDDSTVVNIGRMKLPLSDIASQLGTSPQALTDRLATVLAANGLQLDQVQLTDGQITLTRTAP